MQVELHLPAEGAPGEPARPVVVDTNVALDLLIFSDPRTAPLRMEGLFLGIYYLHLFLGNTFVGWLAGFLDVLPGTQFWALHAALVAAAVLL